MGWVFFFILLALFIKGGYPVLLSFEVVQIVYMHIFLVADPMPFLEMKFLEAIKYFHFTFFPTIFKANYNVKSFEYFNNDMSFVANSSPFIFLWLIILVLYMIFFILSRRKLIKNKTIRHFAKKVMKHRFKLHILHDIFWITFIYAFYFALYQMRMVSFSSSKDMINFFFAMVVLIGYLVMTIYITRLGNKYKDTKFEDIPRRLNWIRPDKKEFSL